MAKFTGWIKDDRAEPRLIVEFAGGYYLTDLERGDIIAFTSSDDDELLEKALLGLVAFDTDYFRIIDMIRRPDAVIQIQAVKI